MAQDVGPEDVAVEEEGTQARRGGLLPLAMLVVVIAVILWLVWQFLGRVPPTSETAEVTSKTIIKVDAPSVVAVPEAPVAAEPTATAEEELRVPDVVGDAQASAALNLEGTGYAVSATYVFSDSTPSGLVVQQNPSAGSLLEAGAVVGIVVSRGTQTVPLVVMPNVIGMSQAQATAKVKAAGLRPYILYGTDRKYGNGVANQWPLGGTELPQGSEGFIQVPK